MANVGDTRTAAELFMDGLLQNNIPSVLRYYGRVEADASPSAVELFLNGEENSRFYLPLDSQVFGRLDLVAYNLTDTDGDCCIRTLEVGATRVAAGTVAIAPTNLSGTDGNPIAVRSSVPGSETITMAADDTNKALVLRFTGEASKNYIVAASFQYVFVAAKMRSSNTYTSAG